MHAYITSQKINFVQLIKNTNESYMVGEVLTHWVLIAVVVVANLSMLEPNQFAKMFNKDCTLLGTYGSQSLLTP